MNISAPFIQRPIATALLMVGLLVGGLVAYPLLPVAALPNVNYPTLQVTAQLPGADPQTMASSVATPLELQFGEIPGLTQMTSASALGYTQITLQFDLSRADRWRGQRHAVGDQCRDRAAAAEHAVSADDPEGQSGRYADPGAWPHLGQPAADHGRRLCGKHSAAKDLADIRRRPRGHRRPAEAGHPRASRSAGAGGARHQPRGRAHGARPGQCRSAQRHAQQPAPDLHAQHQRPAAQGRPIRRSGHRLSQRRAGPHPRCRPRHQCAGERSDRRLVQPAARDHPGDPAPARRQRHRDGGPDQGDAAGARGLDPGRGQGFESFPTAPRPSAPRSPTCSSRCCSPSRWWSW